MARCYNCGGTKYDKLYKGKDNWYHCKSHGRVRKVLSPEKRFHEINKLEKKERK